MLLEAVDDGHHEHRSKSCPGSTTITRRLHIHHRLFMTSPFPFTIPPTPASFLLLFLVPTILRISFGTTQQGVDVKCSDRGEEVCAGGRRDSSVLTLHCNLASFWKSPHTAWLSV